MTEDWAPIRAEVWRRLATLDAGNNVLTLAPPAPPPVARRRLFRTTQVTPPYPFVQFVLMQPDLMVVVPGPSQLEASRRHLPRLTEMGFVLEQDTGTLQRWVACEDTEAAARLGLDALRALGVGPDGLGFEDPV